ncbi:DUF881 domain-containing protein [Nocardioides sp. TF02-7]|uniref:DUF881 domain-containing protein n=1 Tax=Nocardioides sp. TF02-7 TaxID=2917724 RepID=UPI001F05CD2A|nr:DUF881 domain-containing protein [Nocardioides sp. TF02-7]UMG92550.1 DUF881 domain-containing protein [Nocardioides sp. TF02-7]
MADTATDPAERVRKPLLTLITEESLERDYQLVALRRATSGGEVGGHRPVGRLGVVAVVAVFGLMVSLAAVQTSRNADTDNAGRATLIDRIESRRERVQALQARISEQREANQRAERILLDLGDQLNAVESDRTLLETVTGFVPVTGEGVRIELDNAEFADASEQIRDSDLATLVNALFTAGAEAISINGQRLTARSAIRNSGSAIEVNSVGIAPPYVVLAVGDSGTLASRLLDSGSGLDFSALAQQFGFVVDVENVDELRLPAAPPRLRELRSVAQPVGGRVEGDLTP